jgi:hypothetical protein
VTDLPSYELEQKADADRRQLHSSVVELRDAVRNTLDISKNLREHMMVAATATAAFSLAVGYTLTGMFTKY